MRLWTLIVTGALLASPLLARAQSAGRPAQKRQPPAKSKPNAQSDKQSGKQSGKQSDPAFDEAVRKADQARDAGRLDEALDLYGKALQARPDWAEGWWYAGTILYDRDRYADAREAFRNLVALEPKRAHAWGMLGLCEYQTREYDRAVNSLQRGRSLGLADNREIESVVRYHAALLYIRFEQFEVAFDILSEFVREGRESPKIIEAFGLTMMRMPFLPHELPPDKRDQVLIAGRAGFDMAGRRRDEARKSFDELLARFPDAPNVHYVNGVFLLSQDSDAALEEFRRELKNSPSHVPSLLQMAFEYMKRNEHETALPLAEQAAQLAPKLYPARNVLGRVLLELGQVERAVKELEEGARLAPNVPEMHYALARAYTRAGRKQDAARARETFQRLEKLRNAQREGAKPEEGDERNDNPLKAKP
jgi:tetratricopeptide (TPR) repeat protein